jgi:hypothetical protein
MLMVLMKLDFGLPSKSLSHLKEAIMAVMEKEKNNSVKMMIEIYHKYK